MYANELELAKRGNELICREMEIMRREHEISRLTAHPNLGVNVAAAGLPEVAASKINISTLRDLLPEFDGKKGVFRQWEEQVKFIRETYHLDDNQVKVLVGTKLTGSKGSSRSPVM